MTKNSDELRERIIKRFANKEYLKQRPSMEEYWHVWADEATITLNEAEDLINSEIRRVLEELKKEAEDFADVTITPEGKKTVGKFHTAVPLTTIDSLLEGLKK